MAPPKGSLDSPSPKASKRQGTAKLAHLRSSSTFRAAKNENTFRPQANVNIDRMLSREIGFLLSLRSRHLSLSMMLTWLSQYRDIGLLFLRLGIGTMMIFHGWPKLAGGILQWEKLGKAMGVLGVNFFPVFWGFSSAMVETLGGVLLIIGFCFRPVSILMTLNFIVATIFLYKTSHQFIEWSRPAEMLILFFSLIFIGAGKYSVDRS